MKKGLRPGVWARFDAGRSVFTRALMKKGLRLVALVAWTIGQPVFSRVP